MALDRLKTIKKVGLLDDVERMFDRNGLADVDQRIGWVRGACSGRKQTTKGSNVFLLYFREHGTYHIARLCLFQTRSARWSARWLPTLLKERKFSRQDEGEVKKRSKCTDHLATSILWSSNS